MRDVSIKPYLIRAVYEWCIANSVAPYITAISSQCHNLPENLTIDKNVTLNIDLAATDDLVIDNEFVQFNARFNGLAKKISIPIEAIKSIFSKELGHGLSFVPEIMEDSGVNLIETENSKSRIPAKVKNSKADSKISRDKSFLKIVK